MRIKKLRKILDSNNSFPCLITDLTNIRYLTGFSGSNALLLIGKNKTYLISDSRYQEYAESFLGPGFEFFLQKGSQAEALKECTKKINEARIFIESGNITLSQFNEIKKNLGRVKLVQTEKDYVNSLRMVKDEDEIAVLREAALITDNCFSHLLKKIRPGICEWDIAVEIDYYYKTHGCRACSFDPIVASGPGSSMPHYIPSMTKKINHGDVLLIDMGCLFNGYNSDLTRTVFCGNIDSRLEEIYHIVRDAQHNAISAVKPGAVSSKVDAAARDFISQKGYGENFGHGLGHGVGLDIHELPALKSSSEIKLKKNMVITIEPGIYLPETGGVRIEDMVLVTSKGAEVLTKCSKELIVI